MNRALVVVLVVAVSVGSAAALRLLSPDTQAATEARVRPEASDLPAGILIAAVRLSGGDEGPRDSAKGSVAFTDIKGRPLYYAAGGRGKSDCAGACLEKWQPALAAAGARAVGDWTVLPRNGGGHQWAFRGNPLYTFVDEAPYEDEIRANRNVRPFRPLAGHSVDGIWHVAEANPAQWMKLPTGLSVTEIPMAPGAVLVTTTGQPLYVFSGTPSDERKLPAVFRPRRAALLDLPVGDFTIRKRFDGMLQWAYRDAPLFTCECDIELGDVNGKDRVPGVAPVVLLSYFLPAEVALRNDQLSGGRMVEAKTGQTLYYRERTNRDFRPDHVRAIHRLEPTIGATLGISHCDAACEKAWRPLLASQDAQPRGNWTLYERGDGMKQWAYHNYALYTHANEPPGTLFGDGTWLVRFDQGLGEEVPEQFGLGLYWRAVVP